MSQLTLFDLTYKVARELGIVSEGTATGGAAGPPVTLIDTNGLTQADDYWNGGTVWILYDAGGAGAAPEDQFSPIADFATSTDTVTLRQSPEPVLTAAPASGDKYAIGKRRFPLYILVQKVNEALQDLGKIPTVDTTTVTIAASQTEYSLLLAANTDLRQVWVQTQLNDTNDNRWTRVYNWYQQQVATGSADLLVFPYQLPIDYKLKLVYAAPHADLRIASDKLNESIREERIIYPAVAKCLNWYRQKTRSNARFLVDDIARFEAKATEAARQNPLALPSKDGHIMLVDIAYAAGPDQYVNLVDLS